MKYLEKYNPYNKKKHYLSGVVLLIDNRILLVHAKKHKKNPNKWSIPKGHIEGSPLESALKELEEETGIILDKKFNYKFDIKYKASKKKFLRVFVYEKSLEDVSDYIKDNFKIKNKIKKEIDKEIFKVKFFDLNNAKKVLQKGQRKIFNKLY